MFEDVMCNRQTAIRPAQNDDMLSRLSHGCGSNKKVELRAYLQTQQKIERIPGCLDVKFAERKVLQTAGTHST